MKDLELLAENNAIVRIATQLVPDLQDRIADIRDYGARQELKPEEDRDELEIDDTLLDQEYPALAEWLSDLWADAEDDFEREALGDYMAALLPMLAGQPKELEQEAWHEARERLAHYVLNWTADLWGAK